ARDLPAGDGRVPPRGRGSGRPRRLGWRPRVAGARGGLGDPRLPGARDAQLPPRAGGPARPHPGLPLAGRFAVPRAAPPEPSRGARRARGPWGAVVSESWRSGSPRSAWRGSLSARSATGTGPTCPFRLTIRVLVGEL